MCRRFSLRAAKEGINPESRGETTEVLDLQQLCCHGSVAQVGGQGRGTLLRKKGIPVKTGRIQMYDTFPDDRHRERKLIA
jgi:hypothetical protein